MNTSKAETGLTFETVLFAATSQSRDGKRLAP
jgi:hypothetical protein